MTASYVSDLDPSKTLDGQAGATVFMLGTLDAFAFAHVSDMALGVSGDVVTLHPHRADLETVRHGLRGWHGMQDGKSADAPSPRKPASLLAASVRWYPMPALR